MSDTKNKAHIERFLSGNYSEDDMRKVIEDIQRDENTDVLDKHLKDKWMISENFENTQGEEQEYYNESTRLLRKITRRYTLLQRSKRLITVAASIMVLLSAGYLYTRYLTPVKPNEISYIKETTTIGQQKQVTLPDGTTVILNVCSQIEYPEYFSKDSRRVNLTGQAYFHVAKNKDKPFIVHTDKFDVKVLGTEFDVRAYCEDEQLSVNVESGKVQIYMPESMTRLVANEKLIINTHNNNHYKESENNKIAVWRSGNLLFNKTPIREVVKELERVYDCKIKFREGQTYDNQITGEHSNKSLESVLQSIEHTSEIHYKLSNNNEILLYNK
ncbi:FecR family protein [Dysgonomonas sp. ZJ709]|uniref:FecR family protein n=1 Tax=Dysgonomonas sp. ZJ709 TaxID=2709797 RepID=UPI0013EB0F2F|nr:FecR domain-containing protein [Dysgonomonas sp. ZJ709]